MIISIVFQFQAISCLQDEYRNWEGAFSHFERVISCLKNLITKLGLVSCMSLFLFHFASNLILLCFIKVLVHDGLYVKTSPLPQLVWFRNSCIQLVLPRVLDWGPSRRAGVGAGDWVFILSAKSQKSKDIVLPWLLQTQWPGLSSIAHLFYWGRQTVNI